MLNGRMLSRAFNAVIITIIAVLFITAVFLVFRTYEKSVNTDIFSYSHSLEDRVRRVAAAEYRRYLFLLDIGKSLGENVEAEHMDERLESTVGIFGPEGEIPDMIISIGYYENDRPESAREYILKEDEWNSVPDVFSRRILSRGWGYYTEGDKPSSGKTYLAVSNEHGENTIFFRLDLDSFIDTYVKDAVATLDDEFDVEWQWIGPEPPREFFNKPPKSSTDGYSFKPFGILSGINRSDEPIFIEMLGFADLSWFMEREEKEAEEGKDGGPDRSDFFNLRYYIKMTNKNGSYYYDIEHSAAVNFFETLVILLIICLFVILLFIQLQRTRLLRSKEKEFVASVTHELRTPLTVIRSAADNLSTGIVPPEKLKVYSGLITEQSERLGSMIEKILLYSRFEEKKKVNESPVEIDFKDLVADIRTPLDALSSAAGTSLHWDTKGLPGIAVSYPDIISLAVSNIVSNAVNHAYISEPGPVRIRFRFLIPGKLQIEVEDDGRGIESRELKQIFEPFYQDSISRRRQEKGSGLGLFIVKRRLAMVGGSLNVESPYKRIDGSRPSGCRFRIILPCTSEEHSDG